MKREFIREHKWIALSLLVAVAVALALCVFLSRPACCVSAHFLGYAFEMPNMGLDLSGGRRAPAQRGTRVAGFSITNHCDIPVHCALTVRYTDGVGSFAPRDVSLEPHGVTNITGIAGPPRRLSLTQVNGNAKLLWLPNDSTVPSVPDWTNAWHLAIALREAPPLSGLGEKRYRATLWLSQRKYYRFSRFLNPVKIQQTETGLISPDVP